MPRSPAFLRRRSRRGRSRKWTHLGTLWAATCGEEKWSRQSGRKTVESVRRQERSGNEVCSLFRAGDGRSVRIFWFDAEVTSIPPAEVPKGPKPEVDSLGNIVGRHMW